MQCCGKSTVVRVDGDPPRRAQAGVGLLLVPAWDFSKDGWLHSRMAVLRGVEGGYTVARAASRGRLTVSDPYGRILAERTSDSGPEVLLSAVAPIGPAHTFYSRAGDWFAWLCLLFSLACVARVRNRV
jgi:apolipoprotein N-acyltransferase